jgi:hypothetical protein
MVMIYIWANYIKTIVSLMDKQLYLIDLGLHISDVTKFFQKEIGLEQNGDFSLTHIDITKKQFIVNTTNNRIDLWGKWKSMKGDYEMDCFPFSINGKQSKNGIGLDENDMITILLSDKNDRNFFTIDAPKEWDFKDRKGEQYRLYKVDDHDDITETVDLKSWDELVSWYHNSELDNKEPTDDMNIIVTI